MRKLKVYGGIHIHRGRIVRVIVATTSLGRAAKLICRQVDDLRQHWPRSAAEWEKEVAMKAPETAFYKPHNTAHRDYRKMT